jgi:ceramide glucosyltransferase
MAAAVLALLVVSVAYWLGVLMAVRRLYSLPPAPAAGFPPVSILKPVRHLDYAAMENLESFCRQDYPAREVLFGVSESGDRALPLLTELVSRHPEARVVVGTGRGTNPKVAILEVLARQARHPLIVVADSDMRVGPDYLSKVVAGLEDPGVGLVTAPYRGVEPSTFTARLEALYMDCHFVPSAIFASRVLGVPFGLGSTMAVRRIQLEQIGGFEALGGYLADDHELGARLARRGLRTRMIGYPVSCYLGPTSFGEQWRREVRWARATRVSRPLLYPGYLLTMTVPWAVVYFFFAPGRSLAWGVLVGAVAFRWWSGWLLTGWDGNRKLRRWVAFLPVRDFLTVGVWAAGALGRTITWRGQTYRVPPDGTMIASRPVSPVGVLIRGIDFLVRKASGIFEISPHSDCVFRMAVRRNRSTVTLADGTHLPPGGTIGELHFRNDILPRIGPRGPTLVWGASFHGRLRSSLRLVAQLLDTDPRLQGVEALRGDLYLSGSYEPSRVVRALERLGFQDIAPVAGGNRLRGRYAGALQRTFQPRGMGNPRLYRVWMSRTQLLRRYGDTTGTSVQPT